MPEATANQVVEDVAATGILVHGRLSDGDASSWARLRELRWISMRRIPREGGNWRSQDVRRRRERAVIGIDVLALQREAFRSCKPATYLFTDKPVVPSSAKRLSVSSHGNVLRNGLRCPESLYPGDEAMVEGNWWGVGRGRETPNVGCQ